jgi:AbrB family looped-hinge helix DNA binding protein
MHKVGAKGQVVISKEIRDQLGIEPGWEALQRVVDGHVELHFFPPAESRSARGILAPHIKRRMTATTEEEWQEEWRRIREAAWEKAALDRVRGWSEPE